MRVLCCDLALRAAWHRTPCTSPRLRPALRHAMISRQRTSGVTCQAGSPDQPLHPHACQPGLALCVLHRPRCSCGHRPAQRAPPPQLNQDCAHSCGAAHFAAPSHGMHASAALCSVSLPRAVRPVTLSAAARVLCALWQRLRSAHVAQRRRPPPQSRGVNLCPAALRRAATPLHHRRADLVLLAGRV